MEPLQWVGLLGLIGFGALLFGLGMIFPDDPVIDSRWMTPMIVGILGVWFACGMQASDEDLFDVSEFLGMAAYTVVCMEAGVLFSRWKSDGQAGGSSLTYGTEGDPVEELEGRDLDEAVAEEVFGYEVTRKPQSTSADHALSMPADRRLKETGERLPDYSSEIADAWSVVDYFVEDSREEANLFRASIDSERLITEREPSAAREICRAALRAVREKK